MYVLFVLTLSSGGLRPPILKFSFQNPISCNRKRHRTLYSNSTGGYVLGVSSGLATDRGVCPEGSCPPIVIYAMCHFVYLVFMCMLYATCVVDCVG